MIKIESGVDALWQKITGIIYRLVNTRWLSFPFRVVKGMRIQFKILGLVVGVVLLLSTMIIWQMDNILTANLRDELHKQAISIGSDVAARATNELLIDNTFTLYELLQNTMANNQGVLYIFVLDPKGNVLAHTFGTGFPQDLLKANTVSGEEEYHATVFRSEAGIVHDVAVPILNGKLGTVRVGLAEIGLQKAVVGMIRNLLLIALFVSALGIIAAALLTRVLTRPIKELVSLTRRVAAGEMDGVRGVVRAQDEIGVLTAAFNQMTASLSENNREREELLRQLKEKEEMRLQLLQKVITAQEEERKRISRELHDETSQALASLMVGFKVLETEDCRGPAGEQLRAMRRTAVQTLEEVHRLARELRPSVLDDMGLIAALDRYVRDYRRKYMIEVDFHVAGFGEQRAAAQVEITLYRIVQEALTNVAKYARASTVSVLLDWRGDWVSAIVEDDGAGFNPEEILVQPGHGLGLFGMQERTALLGGAFKLESKPAAGTTVFIRIPVRQAEVHGKKG